jgi:hypothetical protein
VAGFSKKFVKFRKNSKKMKKFKKAMANYGNLWQCLAMLRFQRKNEGLIKSDGFSHLFNFASAAFMEQAFSFFAVGNIGFFSYRYISQGKLEQFNEAVLSGFAICALGSVPLTNNRQETLI